MENLKKKNFYIYLGLSFFIFLGIAPWILAHDLSSFLLRSFNAYLAIVISFIAGSLWWREDLKRDVHLEAIVISMLAFVSILIFELSEGMTIILQTILINFLLRFELKVIGDDEYILSYIETRKLATYIITILCVIQLAYLFNPYVN
tara:strand:- start:355 stop:795 length:441 start_codon:yes stop_codon:yes gene_type:complete